MKSATATILTVDDDSIVRADLRLVLEDAGYDVCGDARDGVEAVALARSHRPDLIVLDLALPGLDGVEATRQILDERDVPIVALTGYGTEPGSLAERALEAGATSVVQKPFAGLALVEAVTDALVLHTEKLRAGSREALRELAVLLGYPESWGDTMEAQAYAAGTVWARRR